MDFVTVNNTITFVNTAPFKLIAGPCVLESASHAIAMAQQLKAISDDLGVGFVFKTSFDKANRTAYHSYRSGLDYDRALAVLDQINMTIAPVITDVHESHQCLDVAEHVSILQIPAFLCRQTDLLLAAGKTQKPVMIKKGQFLSPWDMKHVVNKIKTTGNKRIMVCERGTTFGYNNLVVDMRSIAIMKKEIGCPVIFDATHSCQIPGGRGESSSGNREYAPLLGNAAVSIGVAGIFAEIHDNPTKAPSDGPNMIRLDDAPKIIRKWLSLDRHKND